MIAYSRFVSIFANLKYPRVEMCNRRPALLKLTINIKNKANLVNAKFNYCPL